MVKFIFYTFNTFLIQNLYSVVVVYDFGASFLVVLLSRRVVGLFSIVLSAAVHLFFAVIPQWCTLVVYCNDRITVVKRDVLFFVIRASLLIT